MQSCSGGSNNYPEIPGMVLIPAGEFIRGSDDVDEEKLAEQFGSPKGEFFLDERPMKKIHLEAFYIDKYEVTNEDYRKFISEIGAQPPPMWNHAEGKYEFPSDIAKKPITEVTWMHADGYCKWAEKRLPTESEWEKASRGPDGNKYPWGDDYNKDYGNLTPGKNYDVGSFEKDKSVYGVYDLAGNVMEWVQDTYDPYEGNDIRNKNYFMGNHVMRGGYAGTHGHYTMNAIYARGAYRHFTEPRKFGLDLGFRCAKDVETQALEKK